MYGILQILATNDPTIGENWAVKKFFKSVDKERTNLKPTDQPLSPEPAEPTEKMASILEYPDTEADKGSVPVRAQSKQLLMKRAPNHLSAVAKFIPFEPEGNSFIPSKDNGLRAELVNWHPGLPETPDVELPSKQSHQRLFDHFPLYNTYSKVDAQDKDIWPPKNTRLTDLSRANGTFCKR